jgi:hypothetical protein
MPRSYEPADVARRLRANDAEAGLPVRRGHAAA